MNDWYEAIDAGTDEDEAIYEALDAVSPMRPRAGWVFPAMTRRDFLRTTLASAVAPSLLSGCEDDPVALGVGGSSKLSAQPGAPSREAVIGETTLALGGARDGLLYVPTTYSPSAPMPLLVMLHGAGGNARGLEGLFDLVEEAGTIALIPESRGRTWDVLSGSYGPDVLFIDAALSHTFDHCRVDSSRLALAGFSDGASYALSLGVGNGDLFSHLIGFSPGFFAPTEDRVGVPGVFISHGTRDTILSPERTRTVLVPGLRNEGYDVRHEEFDGGHILRASDIRAALEWMGT